MTSGAPTSRAGTPEASRAAWAALAERGSHAALRLAALYYRVLGRRATRALTYPIAAYFFLRNGLARRASRDYLETVFASPEGRRALGRRPGAGAVFHHIHSFALAIFDRLVMWGGGLENMRMDHAGSEHLFALAREGRGALLLSAHLGSFDMMRRLSADHGLAVNVVMYTAHAEQINAFFESFDPASRVRVIQIEPGSMRTAFEIRACVDRGEFVALLGDRPSPGERERTAVTSFLGRPARFPLTPYLLAAPLRCPVLAAFCIRTGEARYETVVKPLGGVGAVPRAEREKHAREMLERFVRELERYCLRAPYQWFNFYDFWADAGEEDSR